MSAKAMVVLYGAGGELDREPIRSNNVTAINLAIIRLANRCVFDFGDRIEIERVTT